MPVSDWMFRVSAGRRAYAALVVVVCLSPSCPVGAVAQQLDTALYAGLRYRFVGPDGNRVSAVAGEPGNPMVAYIGAASGGVWRTTDGGVNWQATFDKQTSQAIGALAVAPTAPNEVWAGTGETFIIRSPTSPGDGIYKSTDRGKTWHRMGLELTGHIGRIVVHPRDADIVFACALGHAYGPQQERGVYRTTDGGRTWTRVLFVNENTGCADLSIDPHDPTVIFAGMWQVEINTWNLNSGGPGGGVYVSRDGGTTWKKLAGHGLPAANAAVGKTAVAVAPSDGDRVYALIEQADPTLYRSNDGGESWRLVSRNHDMAERAPYYVRFAVSPDDPNRLYFVAVRFSMSRDGGETLASDSPRGGGDNHDIWIDPTNADRFMVGNDGGATITLNHGRTFARVVLPIAQMYHVFVDDDVPYNLYGNRQDDGSYILPSNTRGGFGISEGYWHAMGGCESGFGIPDTVDDRTVWSGCYDGGLQIYDRQTEQAREVRVWPEAAYGWTPADLKYRLNWTFPIAISPHDHTRVYVGTQYVHLTTNGGQRWEVISPDLTKNDKSHQQSSGGVGVDNLMTFDGATLYAIAESPVQAGVVWAGSNDGLVHITRDAGANWADVTGNIPRLPPWGKISNIEPSHFDAGTAYISVDLHETADFDPYVYKTTDFGRSWRRIDAGIPRGVLSFAHVVIEDPARRGVLYVGTENAVYFTIDDGAHWQPLQLNLPHAPVSWIAVQPQFRDLVISTYGRGFYILDDIGPLRGLSGETLTAPLTFFQPRPTYRWRRIQGRSSAANSEVSGRNPPYGANLDYFLPTGPDTSGADSSAAHRVTIAITNQAGDTIRTLTGPAKRGINRVYWNLRYPGAKAPRLRTPPPGKSWVPLPARGWRPIRSWDLDLSQNGPLAAPGTYTVIMKYGDTEQRNTLQVLKDPYSAGSAQDIDRQIALALELRDDLDTVVTIVNRVEWIKQQLADLQALLRDSSTAVRDSLRRSIGRSARQLNDKAVDVERPLFDVNLTGAREDAFRAPIKLYGRLSALLSDVAESGADFPPTDQQREVHDLLHGRLTTATQGFRTWLTTDVEAFRRELREAGLPDVVP